MEAGSAGLPEAWRQAAEALEPTRDGSGDVHNKISGGTVHGNAVPAQGIHGSVHGSVRFRS